MTTLVPDHAPGIIALKHTADGYLACARKMELTNKNLKTERGKPCKGLTYLPKYQIQSIQKSSSIQKIKLL